MGIGTYEVLTEQEMIKLRKEATKCAMTGKDIVNPVIDHIHMNECELMGINPDYAGKTRGVISNSSNLALGWIMKEARALDITVNDYLDMIKEYVNKAPLSNHIYPKHLSDIRKYFQSLSIEEKQDYLDYEFGIATNSISEITLNNMLNRAIKEKYYSS